MSEYRLIFAVEDVLTERWSKTKDLQDSSLLVNANDRASVDVTFKPYTLNSSDPLRIPLRFGTIEIIPCPDVAEGIAVMVSGDNPPVEIPLR